MVASNSGRPGGAVGNGDKIVFSKVHADHKTQEEDIISTWLFASCYES